MKYFTLIASLLLIGKVVVAEPSCNLSVGYILPLTGNAASYGKRAEQGALLEKELNVSSCTIFLKTIDGPDFRRYEK